VPTTFPWNELGLSLVWIDGLNASVLYDVERSKRVPKASARPGLPHVAYGADDSAARSQEDLIDLRLLARALVPTIPEHSVEAMRKHYQMAPSTKSEAQVLIGLLQALLLDAMGVDRDVISMLARLLPSPIADVLLRMLVFPVSPPQPEADASVPDDPDADEVSFTSSSVDEALSPAGAVGRSFPAFETRDGQLLMARSVEDAFRCGHAALVEAGPGTGKTFAYLVPAILHLREHPADRVVVSTRTRQLQEQLYGKDLPFLVQRLAPDLKIALLKGRENYLCLRRWQTLIGELSESLEQDVMLPLLAPLVRWIAETKTGDIEENSAFQSHAEARALWHRLGDSPHHCTGAFCPFADDCFSVIARRRARRADLVVVNHSLLLGDLAVDGVVLGKYTHLVVDEAHTLEPVARMAFSELLTERSLLRLADDLAPIGRRRGWLQRAALVGGQETSQRVEHVLSRLRVQAGAAFREMSRHLPDERRARFSSLSALSQAIGESPILLTQLEDALDSLSDHIEGDESAKELEGFIRRTQGLRHTVSLLSGPPQENTVHWVERSPHALVFYATPLDVAPHLEALLYPRIKALVLTSATLSVAGTFDYVCRSIGLSEEAFEIHTLIADSPFDYADRMRILVPRTIPPAHGDVEPYAQSVSGLMAALAKRTRKNGLALFTSYAMMQSVKNHMPADVKVLVQGELSRTALIDRFRAAERPVWLLGTETFWEGVDFPGDELEILLITRLPFPVPTDPVLSAMGERMARDGRDAFVDLSLPLTALKLRQGVGRLIRTAGDRGVVILTDQRIATRGYGRLLAASLPVKIETISDEDALLAECGRWFDREG
jgi:ATP-dependent DNA helicase DinG